MAFNQSQVKEILDHIDIVDVISRYVSLEKKGRDFKGICPFHDDHDPSMSVSPDKQIFKCFVCGAGGNAITFLQKIEEISYPEAVAKAADLAGMSIALPQTPRKGPENAGWSVLQAFIDYARYYLASPDAAQAAAYCEKRRLTPEILERFEIGWAPQADRQTYFFKSKNFDEGLLESTGLENTQGYPAFTNRLLIPIHDRSGHPVAFTARTLSADPEIPKYVNTTGTPLYTKGDVVFNYHRAKEAARKAGRVILVEGAMDVIGLAKAEIYEGIANLGTACTKRQLELIRQLQVPVHVFYDSDRAGQEAAYAFGKMAMEAGVPFAVVKPDADKDPDEIFMKRGADALKQAVNRTMSYPDFLLQYLAVRYDLDNYEDRRRYGEEVFEAAYRLLKDYERPAVFEKIRERTGLDFSGQVPQTRPAVRKRAMLAMPASGRQKAEQAVLQAMLESEQAARRFREEIGFFADETCGALALYIYDGYRTMEPFDPQLLFGVIEEDAVSDLLAGLLEQPVPEEKQAWFEDALNTLKDHVYGDQLAKLNKQIQECQDPQAKRDLAQKKAEIVIARHKLRTVLQ